MVGPTVKPLNFARDLISLILQVMKIREIRYPRKFKLYIDSNSKASRFAKLSTCRDGSNLQFAKLSPREIKVFYSMSQLSQSTVMFVVNLKKSFNPNLPAPVNFVPFRTMRYSPFVINLTSITCILFVFLFVS